ncbi:DTW domain-containing protein, partial [Escherichia coli]|nr:DTW domain-containing protein [Escherichia coli]
CTCLIGEDFSDDAQLNALLTDKAYQHFILYPSEQSQCLSDIACTESERTRKTRLILLDGTWKKAYKMWQLSTNLHAL